MKQDLSRLKDYFHPDDIEWKPIAVSKKTGKALAAAYITSRAIQDRLDDVCGPENWKNEFREGPCGGVLCGISIRVTRNEGSPEWVTKWDGAENTDIEAVKGGLSGSMKRAASQWGIGRYLYRLPSEWTPVDEYGHFKTQPRIPRDFLPASAQGAPSQERAAKATTKRSAQQKRSAKRSHESPVTDDEVNAFKQEMSAWNIHPDSYLEELGAMGVTSLHELTLGQLRALARDLIARKGTTQQSDPYSAA